MKLLLDTHALYWWFSDEDRLASPAFDAISEPESEIYVSAVSAYEIAFKNRIGKLEVPDRLLDGFSATMADQGFREIAVTVAHALAAGRLDIDHRDPFDRMLIAQALLEDLTLVSNEELFDRAAVSRLWG